MNYVSPDLLSQCIGHGRGHLCPLVGPVKCREGFLVLFKNMHINIYTLLFRFVRLFIRMMQPPESCDVTEYRHILAWFSITTVRTPTSTVLVIIPKYLWDRDFEVFCRTAQTTVGIQNRPDIKTTTSPQEGCWWVTCPE